MCKFNHYLRILCRIRQTLHCVLKISKQIYSHALILNINCLLVMKCHPFLGKIIEHFALFSKKITQLTKLYATAGPSGPAKYQLWVRAILTFVSFFSFLFYEPFPLLKISFKLPFPFIGHILFCFLVSDNALCSYPLEKMKIRDSIQILTTAPIFLQCN